MGTRSLTLNQERYVLLSRNFAINFAFYKDFHSAWSK